MGNGMMTMGRNKRVGLINRFPSCRVDGQDVDGRISRLHILDHRNGASIVVYGQGYYVEEKENGLAGWLSGCALGRLGYRQSCRRMGRMGKARVLLSAFVWGGQVLIIPIVYTFDEFPVPTCPSSFVQTWKADETTNFGHFSSFARPSWNATDMRERREFLFFSSTLICRHYDFRHTRRSSTKPRKEMNQSQAKRAAPRAGPFSFLFKSDDIIPGSRGTLYSFFLLLRRWLEIFWREWFMNQAGNLIFEIWRCQFGTGESL